MLGLIGCMLNALNAKLLTEITELNRNNRILENEL